MVIDTGRPIRAVADEIGVSAQALGTWVQVERAKVIPESELALRRGERAELGRLRTEVIQLRADMDILRTALAYFASRDSKLLN